MPKVQKGKVHEKAVHPFSRKAAYLAREEIRLRKKAKQKTGKNSRLSGIGEKLLWFQEQLDPAKTTYTSKDACDIIERYLQRYDPELEQIKLINGIKGRQGCVHGAREAVIKQTIEQERALYDGVGFEIPDIINAKNLKTFREWTGSLKKLPNIKLRKVSSKGLDTKEEKAAAAEENEEDEEDEGDLEDEQQEDEMNQMSDSD
ncbi:translation machinery-associated protein 16 [Hippoglossus hippoglossus]|uniref:translation machinery-associated protein 16 n=1 Tax=Hippoglossus hippoglossus TaxID=8267 RepID=UPI00148E1B9D|nr:translation machinery-associated protein 16 [Hippoglossus hippoglossus]